MTAEAAVRVEVIEDEGAAFDEAVRQDDAAVAGTKEAYEAHLEAARNVPANEREPYRGLLALARYNYQRGLKYLRTRKAEVEERKGVTLAAFEALLGLVLAMAYSLSRLRLLTPAPAEVASMVQEAYGLRKLLLTSLEACACKKLVDPAVLDKVREGKGPFDLAEDCVDLVRIFRENAAVLANRTPVDEADLARADELGTRLLLVLKPANAKGKQEKPAAVAEEEAVLSGLWTLFSRGHKEMRKSAYLLDGDAFNTTVPALLSQERPKKKAPPAPGGTA